MDNYVIIVAGGKGNRMKSSVPKQFLSINNKPILQLTIEAFHRTNLDVKIIVVLPKEHIDIWENICAENKINIPHQICEGGKERFHSVKNGLDLVKTNGIVGIHDGVRPLVKKEIIETLYATAGKTGSAVPYVKVKESVREITENKSTILDRNKIALLQTPQCFLANKIKKAYDQHFKESFTDDASVYEAAFDDEVTLIESDAENIKITTPLDLKIAEILLAR